MEYGIKFGIVKESYDPTNSGRIKVRVPGDDLKIPDEELKWSFPLLPKMLHIRPKVGETVMIITRVFDNNRSDRFYIGPVIAQPQFMYEETDENSALRSLHGSQLGPDINIEQYADVVGTLPEDDDIAFLGRKDSDIILKDNDVRIRCGVKKTDEFDKTEFAFNSVHPAFMKMKHYVGKEKLKCGAESVVNIVADKINLIGSDSREKYSFTDTKELISDEEVDRFVEEAHQLPFGDKLIEFLRIFITAFQSHTHPWVGAGMTPCKDITYKALADYNLESILSTTIRIN